MTQNEIDDKEWANPLNWIGGWYHSDVDSRLWVPKRAMTGSGFTFNTAKPGSRTILWGLTIVPIALILAFVLHTFFDR